MLNTKLKSVAKAVIHKLLNRDNGGEFSRRIKHRNNIFWGTPEGKKIKAIPMHATDPLSKWQDVEHWQRKLSNKHNSMEFAKMYGCRIPGMYWKGKDMNELRAFELPEQYVIRPSIGAGSKLVFLMDGSLNLMDKQTYTKEDIIEVLSNALAKDPRLEFLIEEFVRTEKGEYKIPDDYKLYMFNGEVACIQVINRLSPKDGFATYYDENWNQLENITTNYPAGTYQQAPACLKEMIEDAKRLSRIYKIFARIDFYATDNGAVFGEFTPTPAMGRGFTPAAEQMLVSYWDKYCKGMI